MNTAQVKQAIKKSAVTMANEPLEILKSASRQITGETETPQQEQPKTESNEVPVEEQKYKQQTAEQDGRRLEALNSEIKDITRQKLFSSLMQRIQNGETVPLEEFTELSYEQRDVLKAQQEAVRTRNSSLVTDQLIEPTSAKGRRMQGGKQKQSAQKQTTRVEKPVPPSG